MRCDQCVHWGTNTSDNKDVQLLGVGKCLKAIELWEATEWSEEHDRVPKAEHVDQMMFVMDGSSYRADLYTRPDFFCAHFNATATAGGTP